MIEIKNMTKAHVNEVIDMMKIFYASSAVLTNGSEEIFQRDVENCINDNPYLEGYVFIENESILGYAMIAKSFATEFGKLCIGIEDIYLKPQHCGKGIGSRFFHFIEQKYTNCVFCLEVEKENKRAINVYRKMGYEIVPYIEMKKF